MSLSRGPYRHINSALAESAESNEQIADVRRRVERKLRFFLSLSREVRKTR